MVINGKYRCAKCMTEMAATDSICSCGCDNANVKNPFHTLQIGTVLANNYIVGNVIGEGGFGITYVGWDTTLDLKVAIKELYLSGISNRDATVSAIVSSSYGQDYENFEQYREKFINEAKILAKLKDEPGIVNVFRFFKENNTAYIAMEFIEGRTLKSLLKERQRITVDEMMRIVDPIMNSLSKVHAAKFAHRDISPDNIMITESGAGKLIDFGAARDVSDENKSISVLLKHGYAPIEQYQTHGNQGPWTDVYALSATMYKCLTGQIPLEAIDRISGKYMPGVCEIAHECDRKISDVIMKGLSINYEDRYQTVAEMKQALSNAIRGMGSSAGAAATNAQTLAAQNIARNQQVQPTDNRYANPVQNGSNYPVTPMDSSVSKAARTGKMLNGIIIGELVAVVALIIAIVVFIAKNIIF